MSGIVALVSLINPSKIELLLAHIIDITLKAPGARVPTAVTKYMTPVITAKGNFSYESHASNIEQLQLVVSKEALKGYAKHPNVSFAIQITRKSCKAYVFLLLAINS